MNYQIRYHNKPHELRLSNVHICELAKGIWWVTCDLNLRGYDICCHGGESDKNGEKYCSVYFDDDKEIRAELILYPKTKEERNLSLTVANIYKRTYHAIMVSDKRLHTSWDKYCKTRVLKRKRKT